MLSLRPQARKSVTSDARWRNKFSTIPVEQFPSAIQMRTPVPEVLILRDNRELAANRVLPDIGVGRRLQPNIADMLTFAVAVRE